MKPLTSRFCKIRERKPSGIVQITSIGTLPPGIVPHNSPDGIAKGANARLYTEGVIGAAILTWFLIRWTRRPRKLTYEPNRLWPGDRRALTMLLDWPGRE